MKYLEKIDTKLLARYKIFCELAEKENALIPEMEGMIYMESNLEVAVYYSDLFFPELVEVEGAIFGKNALEHKWQLYESMKLKSDVYTRRDFEEMVNFTRVWDLFSDQYDNNELYIIFAKRLAYIWETHLMRLYPDRKFEVVYQENPEAYELGPSVTFFQADDV